MNQIAKRPLPQMTAEAFLAWPGDGSNRKFELVDGEVRPMPPASVIHGMIQAKLTWLLIGAIIADKIPAVVATEGAIIPALNANINVRIPDIVVGPKADWRNAQTMTQPLLMVEILSPGNKRATRDNVRAYSTLPSVQEIAVVHSKIARIEIHRRDQAGAWMPDPEIVEPGKTVHLTTAGLRCLVDEIYTDTGLLPAQATTSKV